MKDQFSLCTYNSKGHYDLSKSFGCQFAVVEGHITCFLHLFRTLVFLSLKNVTTYAKIYHNSYVGEPLASYMCVCAHQCVRNNEHCNGLHVCWFCVCVCVFVWDKEVRGTVRERVCVCVREREREISGEQCMCLCFNNEFLPVHHRLVAFSICLASKVVTLKVCCWCWACMHSLFSSKRKYSCQLTVSASSAWLCFTRLQLYACCL